MEAIPEIISLAKWKVSYFVRSKTTIAAAAFFRYSFPSFLNFFCPAIYHHHYKCPRIWLLCCWLWQPRTTLRLWAKFYHLQFCSSLATKYSFWAELSFPLSRPPSIPLHLQIFTLQGSINDMHRFLLHSAPHLFIDSNIIFSLPRFRQNWEENTDKIPDHLKQNTKYFFRDLFRSPQSNFRFVEFPSTNLN